MNNQFIQLLKQIFNRLSLGQKIGLATVSAATLLGMFLLLVWANRPEFGLLYSNLDAGDAAAIVDDLKSSNIPYQLKDGGTTILVPSKDIYELRIKYAGHKMISRGHIGYELFDKNNLGLTDFMQKINLKRALEGELTKTINQIEAIQQCRVHLVMPEPALFTEEENITTASVIVKLKANAFLERKQVQGITNMVAASVEGLSPENVVIMDTYGNILTEIASGEDDIALSSSQLELKQKIEKYFSRKAQSMLDRVFGHDNSIVRVSALLNFDKISRTTEKFDPDNTAILSEERNEEQSTRQDTTLYQRENVVTNYEIDKIIEQYEDSIGDIQRLNIAVFVNEIYQEGENTEEGSSGNYIPRSDEEIEKITEIVKQAVGFSEERNDQIVVQQLAFDRSFIDREKEALSTIEKKEFQSQLIRTGLIVFGSIIIFFVFRSIFKKFVVSDLVRIGEKPLLDGPKTSSEELIGSEEIDVGDDLYFKKLSPEAKEKLKARDKVSREVASFTKQEPDQATRLVRYWLLENG